MVDQSTQRWKKCSHKAPETKGECYKTTIAGGIMHVTKLWYYLETDNITFHTHDKLNLEKRQAAHFAT